MRKFAYIAVWLFIAAIPLDRMFIGQIIGGDIPVTVTQVFGVVALMVAIVATLFEGRLRRFDRSHGLVFLFITWACLSSLWSIDPEGALDRVITYLQLGFMLWLLAQYAQSREEQRGFMVAYLCGASFVVAQLFLGYVLGGTVFSFEIFPGRYTSMGYNPNDLALTLAIGIPLAWYVFTSSSGFSGLLALAYMPAALAGILLSASRGGAFAAVVALLIIPIGFFRISPFRKLAMVIAVTGAIVTALIIVPERSWERLVSIDDSATTPWSAEGLRNLELANTRIAIWKEGLEMFQERPFVGVGVGGYLNAVDPVRGERRVAHNVFLSILVELGLIGLALFLTMIVGLLLVTRHMEKDERLMWLLVMLTYLVGGFFLSWEHTKQTWLVMGLLAARSVPLRARHRSKKAEMPDETRAVIARHMERQRWERTRELVVELLLHQNRFGDSDKTVVLLERIVEESDEWSDPAELAAYFEAKLGTALPETAGEWKELAEKWAEALRRLLVSDF